MNEIERKFLVHDFRPTPEPKALRQAYLATGSLSVRIRHSPDGFVLCLKGAPASSAPGPLVRTEIEVNISPDRGSALFVMSRTPPVEKERHHLAHGWTVDVFGGSLRGIVLAEIELSSVDEALPPRPQGLVLCREVTQEPLFHNATLANLGHLQRRAIAGGVDRAARRAGSPPHYCPSRSSCTSSDSPSA